MVESSDKELNVEARKQRLQVEKKLWKTSLALVLVWLFSWSPYASVFLANITGHAGLVTHHLDMLPGTTPVNTHSNLTYAMFSRLCQTFNCCKPAYLRSDVSIDSSYPEEYNMISSGMIFMISAFNIPLMPGCPALRSVCGAS